jgi:hypothetical protein
VSSSWSKPRYRDFTGGENLQVLPEAIAPNEVVKAYNCFITAEGLLETRKGRVKVNTTSLGAGGIISAHRYSKENGSRYVLVQHGTSLYAKSWDGITPFSTWGTAVKTGLTAGKKLRSITWKDMLILTNGTDQAFTFNGTACADVAAIPDCKALYLYSGRLWCVDEATGFLECSNLEDYTDWTDTGSYKVRDGDGDRIVALAPLEGGMVLLKSNTVQSLYGTNPGGTGNISIGEPFTKHFGAVSVDAVLPDGVYMGRDNLYSYSLNSVTPIKPTHVPLIQSMTVAQRAGIFAIPHPDEKRALFYLPTADKRTLCVDALHGGSLTSWYDLNAACFVVCDGKDDSGRLLIGDATLGVLYMYDGVTDDGVAITSRIKTAYADHDLVGEKEWRTYIPEIETLDSTATYRFYHGYDVDYKAYGGMLTNSYKQNLLIWGVDEWGTACWGTSGRLSEPLWMHDARGHRISFETVCYNCMRYNGYTTRYRSVGAQI